MSAAERVRQLAEEYGVTAHTWGETGSGIAERIEADFGMPLPDDLRQFATEVGNLSVGWELWVTGNGLDTCVARTRSDDPIDDPAGPYLVIGTGAETKFCLDLSRNEYIEIEPYLPLTSGLLKTWPSLDDLLTHIFTEQREIQQDDYTIEFIDSD